MITVTRHPTPPPPVQSQTGPSQRPFWLQPTAELLGKLGSDLQGLSEEQARQAFKKYGPNRIQDTDQPGVLSILIGILANPLVLVLLLASGVSAALGESTNAIIIVAILSLSSALEFSQTYRSSQAAARLRQAVAVTALVQRSGRFREIPLEEVVPGDVLGLSAGTLIAADALLLSSKDLSVVESALTGESLPAEKRVETPEPGQNDLAQAHNAVFMGTSVLSGTGQALVVHTGPRSEFGKVAQKLQKAKPTTEFERGIHAFGLLIMRTVTVLVAFVFLSCLYLHRSALESLLFAVALAVGLTPEFLPMIISVTLAAGAARLAKEKVIVKRLSALENLGSVDILCSDKTGTLTLGEIKLELYVDLLGEKAPEVLHWAALNSSMQSGISSPLDRAVLAHDHPDHKQYQKVDELPFDFERRRLSVVVDGPEGRWLVTKGAPESVHPLCGQYQKGDRRLPMDEAARARLHQTFEDLSRQGYRVLSVGIRALDVRNDYKVADESSLCLIGLAAFLDPPRQDARETLAELNAEGIQVKILTGDNELVAAKICSEVGLETGSVLLGGGVDLLSDEALGPVSEKTVLFARLSPSQKSRVIHALRARGHVVGYLGDGINDAPSLRIADIGISVGNAVDVAKEAADIILLEPGLKPVHLGVLEGRRSFGNIMKYILMGTSSNFGNMFSMAGAALFLPFLPLLPAQLLLNTLLYDCSQLGIPSDHVDAAYMNKPRRWNTKMIREFMLIMGPVSSLFDVLTFAVLLYVFRAGPELFRTGWFIESLATQVLVVFVIRTSGRPWRSRPHPALLIGALAAVLVGCLLPWTPAGQALGLVVPPLPYYGFVFLAVIAYLALTESIKGIFFRRHSVQ